MNMKKKITFRFKSIYIKFAVIFLGIWWGFNALTFGIIMYYMTRSSVKEFQYLRRLMGFVFLNSAFFGTLIILLVVRSILKPIKELSMASREVAKGNYDLSVSVNSYDEIGRLSSDFNIMVKELSSIDALRREFVSNVSHEFRTPITAIKGFAKLINEHKNTNENIKEYSEIIITESERLIDLSSNLLRLSELDSQIIHVQNTFSLDEQIRQIILVLEPGWAQKHLEFDLELSEIENIGDEDLLRQVWINLIQNAIKFSHDGGTIKISLYKWNDMIQVKIMDNGIGISSDDKLRIFDRFYKGNAFNNGCGNGLGLSIAKKIVEQSGGNIIIESELNTGTSVIVELPDWKNR